MDATPSIVTRSACRSAAWRARSISPTIGLTSRRSLHQPDRMAAHYRFCRARKRRRGVVRLAGDIKPTRAGGGDRTRTAFRPRDFKSRASASSATPAHERLWQIASLLSADVPRNERGGYRDDRSPSSTSTRRTELRRMRSSAPRNSILSASWSTSISEPSCRTPLFVTTITIVCALSSVIAGHRAAAYETIGLTGRALSWARPGEAG